MKIWEGFNSHAKLLGKSVYYYIDAMPNTNAQSF